MTALFKALDNFTPSQIGENGHSEFTWSAGTRERILQLSFQLTRCKDEKQIENLSRIVGQILAQLDTDYRAQKIAKEEYLGYMSIMFRLVGQTRDIIDGKGEYTLAYMLLAAWYNHHPSLALFAFKCFVSLGSEHPYGSWKDVKHMIKYMKQQKTGEELVAYAIGLLNDQIRQDISAEVPSLAAKWAPREKSAHSELFAKLASDFFPQYASCAKTEETSKKAASKAKMDYRKVISMLNKKLDTVQIKQCGQTWAEIEPTKQTSITMHKQKSAFLNKTKKGAQRSGLEDRIACGKKFEEFASKAEKGEVEIKGKRIGLNDFTQNALELISRHHQSEICSEAQILNAQWVNNSLQTGQLGKMIAMVDVSGSMSGDPMNAAIALGLRIAEKSLLGKRVLTFSASPSWVNLDDCDNFVSMVEKVQRADWGMNTNFAAALNMILDAIVQHKLEPEDVEDMVLTILSDMQIDSADHNYGSMMEMIEKKYAETGMRLFGKPFKAPHILFWNLRSTGGFPALSSQKNASMMSGFSAALLNLFCEEGLNALQSATPWSIFIKSVELERYKVLEERLLEELA